MTSKPAFWISFSIVSILCTVFVFWFFPRAFPIVTLDITMTRSAALDSAAVLAALHQWGPGEEARSVASFELDGEVQTFVELEGGGAAAFNAMLADPVYTPYSWRVRRFREGAVNEVNIRFRPDGRPSGFVEKIAEDEVRPNLAADAARELGVRSAAGDWSIDLGGYQLVESGQEQQPNGRIDHTFVYERNDTSLGEGRYRVRIVVSGDRVSELMPLVRVPQAFSRRYEEMRSANTAIGIGGSVGAILYLLAGCGIGLFYLLRRHALLWRPAVALAAVIAITQILAGINAWPLSWLNYDTAIPAGRFVLQSLLPIIILSLVLGVVMAFSFLAAEGLSRLAFPGHPQFWQIWRRDAAPTPAIAGRTATGYLTVPVMLTYIMVFYFIAGRLWGWWNPSEALVNPDSLAHYAPWFTPFAMALQAGVWEECLFRAVPLAGAALLGQYCGRRGLFIVIALVVQALIFGAAHATYPAQPAYARLVELIIPSLLFGLLYLRYGLLPAIVLHFTFDIVLMSLPIYASSGAQVWLDRILVAILTMLPALVVVARRFQAGTWSVLPAGLLNSAWQAPVSTPAVPPVPPAPAPAAQYSNTWPRELLPVLGIICIVAVPAAVWLQAGSRPQVPVLEISKSEAELIARDALTGRGVELPAGSRVLTGVLGSGSIQDRFIWQTAGRKVYEALIGDWLHPPRYVVRFARFEGDVAERAEEWLVTVTTSGVVRTVRHSVAEGAAGAELNEEQARRLAHAGLERELGISPGSVREISVEPEKQPARTDWRFTFADATGEPLAAGERRLQVDIAGDEVTGAVKLIHIPEEWQRQQRATDIAMNVLNLLRILATGGMLLAGAIAAIIAWSKRRFTVRYFMTTGLAALLAGLVLLGNNSWPAAAAQFSTAQPFIIQAAVILVVLAILITAAAVGAGLIMGMAAPWRRARVEVRSSQLLLAGAMLAVAGQCLAALTSTPFGTVQPVWPPTMPAGSIIPVIAPAAAAAITFITYTLIALLIFGVADRYTAAWTRNRIMAGTLLFLTGALLYSSTAGGTIAAWGVSAVVAGSLTMAYYWLLIRHDLAVIPVVTAVAGLLQLIPTGAEPYPGAWAGSILAMIVVAGLGGWMFKAMRGVYV